MIAVQLKQVHSKYKVTKHLVLYFNTALHLKIPSKMQWYLPKQFLYILKNRGQLRYYKFSK